MLSRSVLQLCLPMHSACLQLAELRDMENKLYDELSRTPKQGDAFAEVVKTVLERESAFVKWKVDGAAVFWDKEAAAPKTTSKCKPGVFIRLQVLHFP